ncbi:unnamed protein product [Meganyctiphanes norvegica]|uniref:Cytochrome b5 heme-binding domain-containing protein n=1 Tax=Meganyctiphanes norvegica TaxID=48144 RepID=A0AAV2PQ97_MEGNR
MAPREGEVTQESTDSQRLNAGAFRGYPALRDTPLKSSHTWLAGKRIDDNIGNYWRVHDKLYDLSEFVDKHPGGRQWIELTRGTDVTESFESSHIGSTAEVLLQKYFIKNADNPRNSPYTFHEDGFYKTLKRKALPVLKEVGTGPTRQMLLMHDATAISFICLCLCAARYDSYMLVSLAGLSLAFTVAMAHNFFHQRDNFRMYYFDLCPLSSSEWRVTHAISHHLFTNSIYDWEISALEPFVFFLPDPAKNKYVAYLTIFWSHIFYYMAFLIEILKRIVCICMGHMKIRPENLLPFIELLLMCYLSSTPTTAFKLWCTMQSIASFIFVYAPLTGTHHHPDIWHHGDATRTDQDWGLCQLDTVRDRVEVTGNLFLVCTTFGDHTLHHMFPTVDHSKLPYLYPVFFKTCQEFGIPFAFQKHTDMHMGFYRQVINRSPNKDDPGYKNNKLE